MESRNNVIAVVDVGSTKVCAMIGRVYPDGKVKIEGEGSVSCRGFKKLMYTDMETITTSMKRALVLAQEKANIIVTSVYLNIRGIYLNYIYKNFEVGFEGKEKEITLDDIQSLIKQASKMNVFDDERIVDVVPIRFFIDGDTEVNDPVGLRGKTLSIDASVIIGHADIVDTLCKCAQRLGLIIDGIIPESYPIAMTQLKSIEKNGTTLLIDSGGKITEYIVLQDGVVVYDSCIAAGGDNITADIASGLDISIADAETLKRDIGYATVEAFKQNRECYITHVGSGDTEMIRATQIISIVETRASYILDKVCTNLRKDSISIEAIDNIVIVGEGLRSLNGIDILIENIFRKDSRKPDFFVETGYLPTYLTAYSIILYISSCISYGRNYSVSTIKSSDSDGGISDDSGGSKKYFSMLKEFFTLK